MNKLNEAELESFSFFEMTPDLVCIARKDGFFQKVNRSVIDKLGYTEAELFSRPISSFMHPEDREQTGIKREKLLEGTALVNFQNRYVKKNGEIIWLDWTSIYLTDKEIVFAIAKDITERKEKEKQREVLIEERYQKFKSLATHFKSKIEKDRKYFAEELHEELAQLAAVIKMDIDWLHANVQDNDNLKQRLENTLLLSGLLIDTIRRIAFTISPFILEDLGLNVTLELLCKEFTKLNNIPCRFESAYDEEDLNHEIRLDFFRICQESLSNVVKHARASEVVIRIEETGDKIELFIMDNGKGFEYKDHERAPGFTIIRELVSSINGSFSVRSEKGKGTMVNVQVPLQAIADLN